MKLPPHEQVVMDRLADDGNPLGWKPWCRDENGHAVLRTVLPAGPGRVKQCIVVLTPKGMVNYAAVVMEVKKRDG